PEALFQGLLELKRLDFGDLERFRGARAVSGRSIGQQRNGRGSEEGFQDVPASHNGDKFNSKADVGYWILDVGYSGYWVLGIGYWGFGFAFLRNKADLSGGWFGYFRFRRRLFVFLRSKANWGDRSFDFFDFGRRRLFLRLLADAK